MLLETQAKRIFKEIIEEENLNQLDLQSVIDTFEIDRTVSRLISEKFFMTVFDLFGEDFFKELLQD